MSCEKNINMIPNNCNLIECQDECVRITEPTVGTSDVTVSGTKTISLIATAKLQKYLEANIKIPEGFSELKAVKKKVILNQAKVVYGVSTTTVDPTTGEITTNTVCYLFVEGYIIKDIAYVTPAFADTEDDCCMCYQNTPKDKTAYVPFSMSTQFNNKTTSPISGQTNKYPILCNTMEGKCCDSGFMGQSLCEGSQIDSVTLNKPPFAELTSYTLEDYQVSKKACKHCAKPATTGDVTGGCSMLYDEVTEKMVLTLNFNIFVETIV